MKNIKRVLWIVLWTLFITNCDERIVVEPTEDRELYYSSTTVCSCYRSGMSVLGNLIEHKDDMYKTLFQELRMNCLTKYGTRLFIPTYCNYTDSLQILMDSLYSMGIDIND